MSAFVQTQPAAAGNQAASANVAHPGQAATDAVTIGFELDGRAGARHRTGSGGAVGLQGRKLFCW